MVSVEIIQLGVRDEVKLFRKGQETCIVVLTGICDVSVASGTYIWENLGARMSVFDMPPDTVYIPCNTAATITAVSNSFKMAVVSVEAEEPREPFVVYSNEIVCQQRGKREWKRNVYDIITPNHNVNSIILGETIHTDGVWSGYPPHKHDTDIADTESKNSEVYYVELEPKDAFSVFVQYGNDWEKATFLKNGDCVVVENGFHAIVSAGGIKLYYLWALDSRDHKFYCKVDDRYNWIKDL